MRCLARRRNSVAITFVQPDTRRIVLEDGAWILVKKRLNAGETRKMFAGVIRTMTLGEKVELDPEKVGLNKILIYLLDWSANEQYPIRNRSSAEVAEALNNLDQESYQAIMQAIDKHEAEMEAEIALEKKHLAGENESSATSTSVA